MPTATALRPRTVTEIVDASFQILKAHYGRFVMCSALAYLPWLVIQLIFLGDPERIQNTAMMMGTSAVLIGMVAAVGVWASLVLMSAVIIGCASQAYLGETVDVAKAVRRAVARLPRVMVAGLVRYLLVMVGLLALLVGALYVASWLFSLTPVIVLEDASLGKAFSRTTELSRGRKFHILNTLGLVGIIYYVILIGVSLLAAATGNSVVQTLTQASYTILAYPVIAITECLLYYDARIQSEGLDIELMAGDLGSAPPPEPVGH